MGYNIFIDQQSGQNVAAFSREDAYEASALVNASLDAGFSVSSDLWSAFVPDAMVTPGLRAGLGIELTQLGVPVGFRPMAPPHGTSYPIPTATAATEQRHYLGPYWLTMCGESATAVTTDGLYDHLPQCGQCERMREARLYPA